MSTKRQANIDQAVSLYKRRYPLVHDPLNHADSLCIEYLKKSLPEDARVLDAGCGKQSALAEALSCTVVGIDLCWDSLCGNQNIRTKIMANVTRLPFKDDTFDAVYSRWVIEHISNPEELLSEYRRVVKPKGKIALMTPNILNPIVFLAKITPHALKGKLLESLDYNKHEDIFATFYHANSLKRLRGMFRDFNLTEKMAACVGYPFYFHQRLFLFKIAMFFEAVTDCKFLRFLKMHLAIIGEKP